MELRRNRGTLVLAAICVLGGVTVLAVGGHRVLRTLVALGAVILGGVVLLGALRPFRFVIGPDGLDVRRPGLRGTYRWDQFDALALADGPSVQGRPGTPRLLGVPGAALPPEVRASARHPLDGRAAVELLDLAQVRQTPDEVADALARYAADRFTDARARTTARLVGVDLDFDFAESLRGYRTERIDELVRHAQAALAHGDAAARQAARAEIEQARATGLPVALRGYALREVDVALDALCAALADPAATDRETAP